MNKHISKLLCLFLSSGSVVCQASAIDDPEVSLTHRKSSAIAPTSEGEVSLKEEPLLPAVSDLSSLSILPASPADKKTLQRKLIEINKKECPFTQSPGYIPHNYVIKVPGEEESVAGVEAAQRCWDFVEISKVYVNEKYRKQGWGRKLMEHLERKALEYSKGVVWIRIDVFEWQSPEFCYRLGYEKKGEIPDCPTPGHTFYHFYKKLELPFEKILEMRAHAAPSEESTNKLSSLTRLKMRRMSSQSIGNILPQLGGSGSIKAKTDINSAPLPASHGSKPRKSSLPETNSPLNSPSLRKISAPSLISKRGLNTPYASTGSKVSLPKRAPIAEDTPSTRSPLRKSSAPIIIPSQKQADTTYSSQFPPYYKKGNWIGGWGFRQPISNSAKKKNKAPSLPPVVEEGSLSRERTSLGEEVD